MIDKKINIGEEVFAVDVLVRKIDVVLCDLQNAYFADDTFTPEDRRKKAAFDQACYRVSILQDIVNDLQETVDHLEEAI